MSARRRWGCSAFGRSDDGIRWWTRTAVHCGPTRAFAQFIQGDCAPRHGREQWARLGGVSAEPGNREPACSNALGGRVEQQACASPDARARRARGAGHARAHAFPVRVGHDGLRVRTRTHACFAGRGRSFPITWLSSGRGRSLHPGNAPEPITAAIGDQFALRPAPFGGPSGAGRRGHRGPRTTDGMTT